MNIIFYLDNEETKNYSFSLSEIQYKNEINKFKENVIDLTYVDDNYQGKFTSVIQDLLENNVNKIEINIESKFILEMNNIIDINYDITPDDTKINESISISYNNNME